MNVKHYYGAVLKGGYWYARVYHYDTTGNREINDMVSNEPHNCKEVAVDEAGSYCGEHGIDAEMDA